MIQIDIPMPRNCLECRFSWAGDSCTYCVAQCYHKPGGGYHLHKINPNYKSREEQDVWREPSCPLIAQEPHMMTLEEVKKASFVWIESKNGHLKEPALIMLAIRIMDNMEQKIIGIDFITVHGSVTLPVEKYNILFRCWTSNPTDEQRWAVKWE